MSEQPDHETADFFEPVKYNWSEEDSAMRAMVKKYSEATDSNEGRDMPEVRT